MRLLFLATVVKEHHEATVGIDLANQLRSAGVESHFIVDTYNEQQVRAAGYAHTIVSPTMDAGILDVLRGVVGEFRPDAIVLSDYVAHWVAFTYAYRTDPWCVEEFGLPVIPLDLYELANTDFELEILGRPVRADDRILSMPAHLRPVPVARPEPAPGDGQALPYRLSRTIGPAPAAERERIRGPLGLSDDERLLVVPTMDWQRIIAAKGDRITRELGSRVPELIAGYLGKLPERTHFLLLGPEWEAFRRLPPERTHLVPSYSPAEHDDWVRSADGVMAFHLPSPALERSVFADVPGLYAVNGIEVAPGAGRTVLTDALGGVSGQVAEWLDAFPLPLPEFHLWPLRWNSIYRPLYAGNPFADAVAHAEILDEPSVVGRLEELLYDTAAQDRLATARDGYRRQIDALPDTVEVFSEAARRSGLSDLS
ncbi:DUF6365 family protein [Streptomyces sp. BE308]|uniref:DUF6365 family protein n=1 Tax=unclassified Streptomyces TaxID=2593676 RepID=UPI002DD913F6|nr:MULTISPECIES: DUF6365 family protein [unclassified Streptomyces]MEE1790029.1 DUF6365 family protein [Streptomyces sp. BE308]WRZ75232.1 DUF6365 family protein [Streptomyces sp. NBC_01237]